MNITPLNGWIEQKHGFSVQNPAEMERYRIAALRRLVAYARKRSRFYSRLYDGLPFPECVEDFQKYPLTCESDLVENGAGMLCIPQSEVSRIVTLQTSGTTHSPKRIFFSRGDIALTIDFFRHGMATLCSAGDRALILFPGAAPDSVGALLRTALRDNGLEVFLSDTGGAAELIAEENITVVCGPPRCLVQAAKSSAGASSVRAVLSSSDLLETEQKRVLISSWGCEVFDHYGMTEAGLGIAVECRAHTGMHIRENDLYFETISSDGSPLPDGEYGELVMTTLTRSAMPFIRYRTGDFGRILSARCDCSSALRRIESAKRRKSG